MGTSIAIEVGIRTRLRVSMGILHRIVQLALDQKIPVLSPKSGQKCQFSEMGYQNYNKSGDRYTFMGK